jgi:hypothetical protein
MTTLPGIGRPNVSPEVRPGWNPSLNPRVDAA